MVAVIGHNHEYTEEELDTMRRHNPPETLGSIYEWQKSTFGAPKATAVVGKLVEEMTELMAELDGGNVAAAKEEAIDTWIVLGGLLGVIFEGDFVAANKERDRKMNINVRNGIGNHK